MSICLIHQVNAVSNQKVTRCDKSKVKLGKEMYNCSQRDLHYGMIEYLDYCRLCITQSSALSTKTIFS